MLGPTDPLLRGGDHQLQPASRRCRPDGRERGRSSSALIGFGLDSVIEVSSAAAVAWQFAGARPRSSGEGRPADHRVLLLRSGRLRHDRRHPVARSALVKRSIRPLAWPWPRCVWPSCRCCPSAQRRAGRELGSRSAVADSKQTLLCTYLSAVLLVGLGLNRLFGWSWADPIAALVIAGVAVREGGEAWRGDACCGPVANLDGAGRQIDDIQVEGRQTRHDSVGCGPDCSAGCCSGGR